MIDWAAVALAALGVILLAALLARLSLAHAGGPGTGTVAAAASPVRLGGRLLDDPGQAVRDWALPLLVVLAPLFLFAGAWAVAGIAIVAGLWLARRAFAGRFLPRTPLDWPIALMMAMLPVSLLVSFDVGFSLPRAALLVYGVALYYAFADWLQAREGRLKAGVYAYLAAGGAIALLALVGTDWQERAPLLGDIVRYLPQVAGGLSRDRTGFHPNIVAGTLLWVVMPLAALLPARGVSTRARWALGALLVLAGGTLLLTQSRGALGSLAVGLALLAWLAWPKVRPALVAAAGVAALVLLAAGPGQVLSRVLDRAGTTLGPLAQTDNLVVRADAWQSAVQAISDRPLTGIGMDTFRRLIRTQYPAPSIPDTYDIGHAHNQFLQAALDLGLPGLVGFLALWIVAAALAAKSYRAAPDGWTRALAAGIGAGLLATFAHGLTDSVALVSKPGVFFWGILALDVALWSAVRAHERPGLSESAARWLRGVAAPALVRALPVLLPTALALGLRLYGFDRLSLWLEEGVTLQAARLPWVEVLALAGAYDTVPPLYYALAKLAATVLPETEAARLLSVAAGTLTVAVVIALVGRLAGRGAGVVAGLALAVAPVHIWYSQEARPYVLAGLLVALSYLALAAYRQEGRSGWAAVYAGAVAAALYTENGAIYALVPQLAVFAWVWRERGRRALPLVTAGLAAVAMYLPWLLWRMPDVAAALRIQTGNALTLAGLGEQAVRIAGLGGVGTYAAADPSPWHAFEGIRVPAALAGVVVAALGLVALARRSWFAVVVVLMLTLGTAAGALAVDLFAPAYSAKITLYLLVGWVALLGAAGGLPRAARAVGVAAGVALLLVSSGTLAAMNRQADKQHWRELADRADEVARYGLPVAAYPESGPAATLLDAYRPGVISPMEAAQEKSAFWLAHAADASTQSPAQKMAGKGYAHALRLTEQAGLYLDLYLGDPARIGTEVAINGRFEGPPRDAYGWDASGAGARLEQDDAGGRRVALANNGEGELIYASAVGPVNEGLYAVQLETQTRLESGAGRMFLQCIDANGDWIAVAPDAMGRTLDDTGGRWRVVRQAVGCPAGTERIRVDLRNGGKGEVAFRQVTLWKLGP